MSLPRKATPMPLTAIPTPLAHARRRRPAGPLSTAEAEVLRIVSDTRTPVFVTERAGGRRRYSYWRPVDSATGRGGCYAALPTDVCDRLREAGRITLGEAVTDTARTTRRVSAVRPPAAPLRAVPDRRRARAA
ncbi:hypothetical protein [Streptomyces sp. NPDC003717]|uniref:hypothetical protein n=1 Tax=Streptomyces sp. NPDC003717 TaxID=3154276 RepID=UPI0033B10D07